MKALCSLTCVLGLLFPIHVFALPTTEPVPVHLDSSHSWLMEDLLHAYGFDNVTLEATLGHPAFSDNDDPYFYTAEMMGYVEAEDDFLEINPDGSGFTLEFKKKIVNFELYVSPSSGWGLVLFNHNGKLREIPVQFALDEKSMEYYENGTITIEPDLFMESFFYANDVPAEFRRQVHEYRKK